MKKQGDKWANDLKNYLTSCLHSIQLNQIIVDNHDRGRAINIYENLNKGGVPLGTFELIMARFASKSTENYYDKLVQNMKKERKYPLSIYSDKLRSDESIKAIINNKQYIATLELNCFDSKDEDIVSTYINAYLNVISLYSFVSDFDTEKIKSEWIKKNKILEITADDLKNKCSDVCEALDLALFFLQMRCGIRNIKEINYNLMLVVIAYIILNDDFKKKKITYDYLEAWYWTSIFFGFFKSDQTERAISSIKKLIISIRTEDSKLIQESKTDVFDSDYFSKKEFLLLENNENNGILPKEFLKDTICQFFLAQTYGGIFDQKLKLNPFCKYKLEKHHVIPLGSLKFPNDRIKKSEENFRGKKDYFLNSPVNFIYITDEENKDILNDKLEDYKERIVNPATKATLGLIGSLDTSTEDKCREVLENRFEHIRGQVLQHIDRLIP